ncbi:MAG: 30S ribosomal protein S8 [Candidatus Colwellbacteria bacterium CG_4_9_14_0_2_um_filter_50_12]|uniref:Small ribosomal subunit protein uS8 n=1 Tax=Candidatus Colwellbacteria bacterium CG_4_9_14_0_2_um_filter_50_12 TaxID=1974538 RepID=A0A2M8G1L9_9BACT|nr:MAG: 30S ribosomal protein S8 [Candidatus Colwellbacteria bacterium CG_4_9_14_0_2_um_filter_50_12]
MYGDMLARIRNGLMRKLTRVKVPYSAADLAILEALVKYGYITQVVRKGRGVKRIIDIELKYGEDGAPAVTMIKLISKPSRRVYAGYRDIKRSRQGYGRYILSTPQGIKSDSEVRREKIGGEMLFEIW